MSIVLGFFQWLFCRHRNLQFLRPLKAGHRDDLHYLTAGYRTVWICPDCMMHEYRRDGGQ